MGKGGKEGPWEGGWVEVDMVKEAGGRTDRQRHGGEGRL